MFIRNLGHGVEMKLLEVRHAPAVYETVERNREYLRLWLPWVDKTHSVDDIEAFIKMSLDQFAGNQGFAAGIWQGRELIGTLGFHRIDWPNKKAELGYWLDEAHQGKGIISAACRAGIEHAFAEWRLIRVEIHCATANKKSCAIPQRLGFQFEGVRRDGQILKGSAVDINVYSMLAREWHSSAAGGVG
jgi:ribosomal-protein-serine acetyltransferase